MKIVVNRCFGGFGLSVAARKRYLELSGNSDSFCDYELDRNDPILVQVVEELGSRRASGQFASLEVVEIPDGVEWTISDYDGVETIEEAHRSW